MEIIVRQDHRHRVLSDTPVRERDEYGRINLGSRAVNLFPSIEVHGGDLPGLPGANVISEDDLLDRFEIIGIDLTVQNRGELFLEEVSVKGLVLIVDEILDDVSDHDRGSFFKW